MRLLSIILLAVLDLVPKGNAFLNNLQKRDSILIADQVEYGFRLDSVAKGTVIALPDFSAISGDTLTLVENWELDTLRISRKKDMMDIRGRVVFAPFEEGVYELPPIMVARTRGKVSDTLLFEAPKMEVKTMPVDTTSFQPHDIKGIITYPVTLSEVLPWLLGAFVAVLLLALGIWLFMRYRERKYGPSVPSEPAHITALRLLDKYRGSKFWAPDKQKAFYSGVTDVLKNYIDARFGVDAPEMTTAELFDALKDCRDITPDLYEGLKDMFERADFVKFAKHLANDDENASVLPLAVRFVTATYQNTLEEEQEKDVL